MSYTVYTLLSASKRKLFIFLSVAPRIFDALNSIEQNKTIQSIGDVLLLTHSATALTPFLMSKVYKATWQLTKVALLNQAVTFGLKYAADKKRPFNNGLLFEIKNKF